MESFFELPNLYDNFLSTDDVGVPGTAGEFKLAQSEEESRLVQDLERRVEKLERTDDAEFGTFTRLDHVILIVGAVLIPVIAMILAR